MPTEEKTKKQQPPNIPPKKPKLSKAERRALQEQQRAAKAAKQAAASGGGGGGGGNKQQQQNQSKKSQKKQQQVEHDSSSSSTKAQKDATTLEDTKSTTSSSHEEKKDDSKVMELFSHLPQYRDRSLDPHTSGITLSPPLSKQPIHPAILSLGRLYANNSITGANARCRAMMHAFKTVISSYPPPPPDVDFRHDLDVHYVKPSFQHLTSHCRPHSITMGNAVTFLKRAIQKLDREADLTESRRTLCELIDAYMRERIGFADEIIAGYATTKVSRGDVIAVYGYGEAMEAILDEVMRREEEYHRASVRVIFVDARPTFEGRVMLRRVLRRWPRLNCSYILLNSLSYVMKEVTKVFLGAAALMSDGSILSRVGTAVVALVAREYNVPVLVACETYKISHRVQLESITGNELGDPDEVARTTRGGGVAGEGEECLLGGWRDMGNLKLLNLMYDLTPSHFVSGIITELGILPPTSVTVLLRELKE